MSHWQDWMSYLLHQMNLPASQNFQEDQLVLSFEQGDQLVFENNTEQCLLSLRFNVEGFRVEDTLLSLLKKSDPLEPHQFLFRFGYTENLGFIILIPMSYTEYQKEDLLQAVEELSALRNAL